MNPFLVRLATEIPFLVDDVLITAVASFEARSPGVMAAAHPQMEKMRKDLKPQCTMTDGVGVIPVSGVLMQKPDLYSAFFGEAEDPADIADLVNSAAKDPKCKAIVLNLDTPGGMMTGGVELADAVAEAAKVKPVVAWTGSLCASLGYLIASQCSAVISTRAAQVGSIGTILSVTDLSALYEKFGVKVHTFTNTEGTLKALTPMNDERATYLQGRADAAFATFKGMVSQARPGIKPESMKGQIFTGSEAVKNGMVDCIGSLPFAIEAAREMSSGKWLE